MLGSSKLRCEAYSGNDSSIDVTGKSGNMEALCFCEAHARDACLPDTRDKSHDH